MGPLFGAVLARALDEWWDELDRPDPFFVIEAAAATGTLARAVLDAEPECVSALRYVMVERSDLLREQQARSLPLEPSATVMGPLAPPSDGDDEPRAVPGRGPRIASLAELPAGPLVGVVLANELLDNLPFAILERGRDGWLEVRVAEAGDGFAEQVVPARPVLAGEASRLFDGEPPPREGSRIPIQSAATDWLRSAMRVLERGRVVAIDYGSTTSALAPRAWTEWVRTYKRHGRGSDVLEEPGSHDITCEVCVDQLARVRAPDADRSQSEFLRAHGLEDLASEARARWESHAASGDLESVKARSRVSEASALTDPAGLGAFRVLEWRVP